jgi:predicted ArsR family transcriptional regulator
MPRPAPDEPGDVLAQSTRARLFARLAELGRPTGTDELAAELGLHRSGVRVHLERLEAAGLISRERLPQPRGRPRHRWQVAVDALPGSEPPDAHRQLASWLASSIPGRPGRLREVERSGRRLGYGLPAVSAEAPAEETIGRTLTALGFAPRRERTKLGTVAFTLGNCPYRDPARENPAVICSLHRGLTLGLLDRLGRAATLRSFVPADPDRAGCLLEVADLDRT